MLKYFFPFIIFAHALIHLMGFAKAYHFGNISQLTRDISKPLGLLWLFTCILFITAIILFYSDNEKWWLAGAIAAVISQFLIFSVWKDAKYGTIVNVIALTIVFLGYSMQMFENKYKKDVSENLLHANTISTDLLTENDLTQLPALVQKYLRYADVLNKPKVKNVRIEFYGQMRSKGKEWFPFTSEQYNFFDEYTRLFFMKGKMFGTTIPGYHIYKNKYASMDIRLLGLFPVVNITGDKLFRAETVTLFNDMCLFAPAALIDRRITWENIDSNSVKATLNNNGTIISAMLYFNKEGQLINFVSDDRIEVSDMKNYRFSTPVKDYKNIGGYNLGTYGEGIWHYPDGTFVDGQFNVKNVQYNVTE